MTDSWHSYPKIYALGHPAIRELFSDPVVVQEKVDGSQFSFGSFGGQLRVKSKGAELFFESPQKMFTEALEMVKSKAGLLKDGWTYRGEYLQKSKHNVMAYPRIPKDHVILFDTNTDAEAYLSPEQVREEADRLGLECVETHKHEVISNVEDLAALMALPSGLGGPREGLVFKNYARFGADKKVLMGKMVSEQFKEVHQGEWRKNNPTAKDTVEMIGVSLRTPARWHKSIQRLRELGQIEDSPRDIGLLIKEIRKDVVEECREDIKDRLYKFAIEDILRVVNAGFPQWYKDELAKKQFEEKTDE